MSSSNSVAQWRRLPRQIGQQWPRHRGTAGVRYALRMFFGTVVLWELFGLAGDHAPVWAMVSMVMVSEIELHASVLATFHRVAHMAVGCAVGLIFLAAWRPGIWQLALACMLSAAASFYLMHIGGNWRTAPVATVIIMGAGFDTFTKNACLHEAVIRTVEVLGGCLIALAVSWAANKLWRVSEEVGHEVSERL
ncbi:MAG: FUSC family protein [Candidatus Acidiferrales bacterium]